MDIIAILLVIIVLLFALAYFTKRRFGVLGLALAAGSILSTMWVADVTPLIRSTGIELVSPPLTTVVGISLVLLPAIVLLFSGPTYHSRLQRVLGAAMFALLATSFMLGSLGSGLNLGDNGQQIYKLLVDNRSYIITAAIIYALFDILTIKSPKKEKE
jgi:hypothetical protein